MKVGDLVVCDCENEKAWYKGKIGLLVGYDHFGIFNSEKGDPLVMYHEGTIRLAGRSLKAASNGMP